MDLNFAVGKKGIALLEVVVTMSYATQAITQELARRSDTPHLLAGPHTTGKYILCNAGHHATTCTS